MSNPAVSATLDDARTLTEAARLLTDTAVKHATELTHGGQAIDAHQVVVDRVAYAATEVRAACELLAAAKSARAEGRGDGALDKLALAASAALARAARNRLEPVAEELGLTAEIEGAYANIKPVLRRAGSEALVREHGRRVAEQAGKNTWPLDPTL